MRFRTLAFSLAPLVASFAPSLAHAQAPGEVQPVVVAPVVVQPVVVQPVVVAPVVAAPAAAPPVEPPPAEPPPIAPPPGAIAAPSTTFAGPQVDAGCGCDTAAPQRRVRMPRWGVGFSIGGMSLSNKDTPDEHTGFAIGELSLRFRATRHLELEASVGGGRERTADDMDGDLEFAAAGLSARWHFMPDAAWNLYAMAGFGGAALTFHDATDDERGDAVQPFGMLGIGIERRFRHLALQAELRGIAMGKAHPDDDVGVADRAMTVSPSAETERAGAQFSIGLGYYF